MARPPKPTALHALHGTTPDRDRSREPKPTVGVGRPPAHLAPIAASFWRKWAPILTKLRVLTEIDAVHLQTTAAAYANWRLADAIVRREGLTITEETKAGTSTKRHPADIARVAWHQQLEDGLAKLGMDPVDRTRVASAEGEVDPMEAFLGRRRSG